MPATARQVSKQLKLRSPSRADAAYNAGPHRVNAWLPENNVLPADVWVDTIPFTETREYVRAILAYTALFEWKLNQRQSPTRLSVHLQPVTPLP